MNRRSFLRSSLRSRPDVPPSSPPLADDRAWYASRPPLRRSNAGLEPYSGPWDEEHAEHLLRRLTFGSTRVHAKQLAAMSLSAALQFLLEARPAPTDPVGYGPVDINNPSGSKRIYLWSEYTTALDGYYRAGFKAWWVSLMRDPVPNIREKMTLFWHNHFATELSTVGITKYMHIQNQLLRQHALGNFRTLVRQITIDPAMLVYLNGNANTKGRPNENFARELQELFTIGKGPEVAPGDYTHYTETDVREAARVLTGWRDVRTGFTSQFVASNHDATDKTFSHAYQNTVITGRAGAEGANELDDLITMIFNQTETAKAICRKIYRWFVYYDIDAGVEATIITPLADILRSSNYEIRPVLAALFQSAHFFADNAMHCIIKNPADFTLDILTRLNASVPDPATDQLAAYNAFFSIAASLQTQQMDLFEPPSVAGWPAYYQSPQFHELWINSVTLPLRGGVSDALIDGKKVSGTKFPVDVIALAKATSTPADPRILIAEFCSDLLSLDLTAKQKDHLLTNVFLPGLPDYEWSVEWADHLANPTNTQKKAAVTNKLNALLKFLLRMAEFQLS